jgi:hypothetical protein
MRVHVHILQYLANNKKLLRNHNLRTGFPLGSRSNLRHTNEQKIPQRIPLELLNRDKILAEGGGSLSISTRPVRASSCNVLCLNLGSICAF